MRPLKQTAAHPQMALVAILGSAEVEMESHHLCYLGLALGGSRPSSPLQAPPPQLQDLELAGVDLGLLAQLPRLSNELRNLQQTDLGLMLLDLSAKLQPELKDRVSEEMDLGVVAQLRGLLQEPGSALADLRRPLDC